MELMDEIKALAERISDKIERLQTEEATKAALIMPFIGALGYDVFDPAEVIPEYTADFGVNRGARVDYAIMQDGKPIILFECKSADVPLDDRQVAQLAGYFAATDARFAILTNGVMYRFYSDLDKSNKMDLKPFLEINMLELDIELCLELRRFTKVSFDVSDNVEAAVELKYTKEIKRLLSEQLTEPSDEFVKFFVSQIYSGRKVKSVEKRFEEYTRLAFNQFVNEHVYERFKSAMTVEEKSPSTITSNDNGADSDIPPVGEIVTTEEELQGYFIVKTLLHDVVDMGRVMMRDKKGFCGISLDDNQQKTICRLYFNGTRRYLGLLDEKREEKVPITDVEDICTYAHRLKAAVRRYEGGSVKHDEEPDQSLITVS